MADGDYGQEIVLRMVIDASDLERLLGVGPSVLAGAGGQGEGGRPPAGGVLPVAGQTTAARQVAREGAGTRQDSSWTALLGPLASLPVIEKILGGMSGRARVAGIGAGTPSGGESPFAAQQLDFLGQFKQGQLDFSGQFAGGGGGAGDGAGGGSRGLFPDGGRDDVTDATFKGVKKAQRDPSFMSIFKPIAALSVIEKTLGGVLARSTVANTYLGAMGKMFGAAIDMLLLPLTPIFNLIMVVMSKLLQWLVTSGILQKLYEVFSRAAEYLRGILDWIAQVWTALKEFDLGKLAKLIIEGVVNAVKTAVKDPMGALAAVGTVAGIGLMASKLPLVGGIFGGAAGGLGGLGARGAAGLGGMAGGGALAGLGIAAAGVGGGYLGYTGIQESREGSWMGVGKSAAGGALLGGAVGSVVPGIGTGVGAAAGGLIGGGLGLAGKFGLLGGGGEQAGGAQSIENVGNVANISIEITDTEGMDEERLSSEIQTRLDELFGAKGYEIHTRSY